MHITFTNDQGKNLSGFLDMPVGEPVATAVFAHCFTCTKNLKAISHISTSLRQRGIAVLRFDFTGLGQSEGDFADTNFSSNIADLVSAAKFLAKNHTAPFLLVGHSLGGAAALRAAAQIPSVRAVATIGAPADPRHIKAHFSGTEDEIWNRGEAQVDIGGRPFNIKRQFLEDLEKWPIDAQIAGLGKALLIMHAPNDRVVDIDNARRIYEHALHPKSFVSLDGADHLLTRASDAQFAGSILAAWASRYLVETAEAPEPEIKYVQTRTFANAFVTDIRAGAHYVVADEPKSVGGGDTGLTPYGLLLAALGACTGMTVGMYARRKNMAVNEIRVRLSHTRSYATDCQECGEKPAMIEQISREIEFDGDLSESDIQRLTEIADKCPVHKSLQSSLQIHTHVVKNDIRRNSENRQSI